MNFTLQLATTISGSSIKTLTCLGKLMENTLFLNELEIVLPYSKCSPMNRGSKGWGITTRKNSMKLNSA